MNINVEKILGMFDEVSDFIYAIQEMLYEWIENLEIALASYKISE